MPRVSDVVERARRMGPLPYSVTGRRPPPPVPELAAHLAVRLDRWWDDAGRPDPWTVVEVGAGDGKRAADVLGSGLRCRSALRYVAVEDDAVLRAQQNSRLPVESPILVLGPVGPPDGDADDAPVPATAGIGPLVTSLAEPPVVDGPAAIVAVGWVSRLPSDRIEWREGRWWEIRLAASDDGTGLEEIVVDMDLPDQERADQLVPPERRVEGGRYARLDDAVNWLAADAGLSSTGRLAVIDVWSPVTSPLKEGEEPPLAFDQLAAVRKPIEPAPEELFPGWSIVTWRLG